jgi:hypothetical protein
VLESWVVVRAIGQMNFLLVSLSYPGRVSPELGWWSRPYLYHAIVLLPVALGWPLYLLALAGIVVAVRRRDVADRLLLGVLVPYLLAIGRIPLGVPRYILPVVPIIVLLAARAAVSWRRLGVAALAAVWLYSLAFTATQIRLVSFDQQREVARWIATHIPERPVRVGFPGWLSDYYGLRPFLEREGLTPSPAGSGFWLFQRPEVFVVPQFQAVLIERDTPTGKDAQTLAALADGSRGYREAARWTPWFLHRDLYSRLDPTLGFGLGSYGFIVYVREH